MPIIERPLVSKDSVHTTGSPVVAAPATAASTSSRADMVSIQSTSAPPSASAAACSANALRAASGVSAPSGSNSSPAVSSSSDQPSVNVARSRVFHLPPSGDQLTPTLLVSQ